MPEPELHAGNLHFYHNEMINTHAFVSLTKIGGGDIYIYGNTAVSLPEREDGWTIFKISSWNPTPLVSIRKGILLNKKSSFDPCS